MIENHRSLAVLPSPPRPLEMTWETRKTALRGQICRRDGKGWKPQPLRSFPSISFLESEYIIPICSRFKSSLGNLVKTQFQRVQRAEDVGHMIECWPSML